eukprot:TRINITY_DN491_c4_g1_i1.p1 TRINITY_DN491_c4_g1~~TRINITY_DN491_c4_g1_i1.p1  ORF type:complete len:154 (-),score=23.19 TRINITY_DN491_c4_g1_i1:205-666(-)
MSTLPTSGKVYFLNELGTINKKELQKDPLSIRTIGRVVEYKYNVGTLVIEHKECRLEIDINMLNIKVPGNIFNNGDLYQFIGELNVKKNTILLNDSQNNSDNGFDIDLLDDDEIEIILKPRIYRSINDLDEDLYEKSIMLQRKYLAKVDSMIL